MSTDYKTWPLTGTVNTVTGSDSGVVYTDGSTNTYYWPPIPNRTPLLPSTHTPGISLGDGLELHHENADQVLKVSEQIRYSGIISIKQDEKNLLVRKGYDVDNLNKMLAGTTEDQAFANDIIQKNTTYLSRILRAEVFQDNPELDKILHEYYYKNKGRL